MGVVAIHRGDVAAARTALTEALALRAEQGNPAKIAQAIAALARVAMMAGNVERAARLLGAAEVIRAAHGLTEASNDEAEEEQRTVALLRGLLDAAIFAAAVEAGRSMSLPETLVLAGCDVPAPLQITRA